MNNDDDFTDDEFIQGRESRSRDGLAFPREEDRERDR